MKKVRIKCGDQIRVNSWFNGGRKIIFLIILIMFIFASCTNNDQSKNSSQIIRGIPPRVDLWKLINETTWNDASDNALYVFYTDNHGDKKCIYQLMGNGMDIILRKSIDFEIVNESKLKIKNDIYTLNGKNLISENKTLVLWKNEPLIYDKMGQIDMEIVKSDKFFVDYTNGQNKQKKYTVFPVDYDISTEIGNKERYMPTDEEIQSAIEALDKFLSSKKEILELEKYGIQFFGYINENREKIIWALYFCDYEQDENYWRNNLIIPIDGGNCYVYVKFNVDTKEVFDFYVNGEA
jgi:hypothetical protein